VVGTRSVLEEPQRLGVVALLPMGHAEARERRGLGASIAQLPEEAERPPQVLVTPR
jgi:hypothetical protein